MKDKNLLACVLILAAGTALAFYYLHASIGDFGNYYFGSYFISHGTDAADVYEPYKFNLLVRENVHMRNEIFFLSYAPVPPFSILFYLPFTLINPFAAKLLFNCISVTAFAVSVYRLLKYLRWTSWQVWLLPVIFFVPFRNNIALGQSYLLLTSFLIEGFLAEERKQNAMAALFYSLCLALKISPAILLIYLLVRKKKNIFLLTASLSTVLMLLPAAFTGFDFCLDYVVRYLPRLAENEINDPFSTNYQSLFVLFKSHFVHDKLLNPEPLFHAPVLFHLFLGASLGTVFFFFVRTLRILPPVSAFGFTLLSGILLSAYTSVYSLLLLTLLLVGLPDLSSGKKTFVWVLAFLISTLPVHWLTQAPRWFQFPRLLLLLILFFSLADIRRFSRREIIGFCSCVLLFCFYRLASSKGPLQDEYYLEKEEALLIYDYRFTGRDLILKYISETGGREKAIPLSVPVQSVYDVGDSALQRLEPDWDEKYSRLKPKRINENEVIYLSDVNRGIGFYTLRKFLMKKNSFYAE